MGGKSTFPINFSSILKHTGVKPSLVPRLYPRTQTNRNVKRDGVWQTGSARRRLPAGLGRRRLADGVWQTRCLSSARRPARHRLPDGLGRRRLANGVWQTTSGRRRLADTVCQGRLVDGVCQAIWQTPHLSSARRPWQTVSGRLADAICQGRLPDGVWQVWQMPSVRHRLVYVAIGLSTRVKPWNEARLNSCVF